MSPASVNRLTATAIIHLLLVYFTRRLRHVFLSKNISDHFVNLILYQKNFHDTPNFHVLGKKKSVTRKIICVRNETEVSRKCLEPLFNLKIQTREWILSFS